MIMELKRKENKEEVIKKRKDRERLECRGGRGVDDGGEEEEMENGGDCKKGES